MNNKYFAGVVLSIEVAVCSFVVTCAYISMANDLTKQVSTLEQENIQLKWELEQVDQMVCTNEEKTDE